MQNKNQICADLAELYKDALEVVRSCWESCENAKADRSLRDAFVASMPVRQNALAQIVYELRATAKDPMERKNELLRMREAAMADVDRLTNEIGELEYFLRRIKKKPPAYQSNRKADLRQLEQCKSDKLKAEKKLRTVERQLEELTD